MLGAKHGMLHGQEQWTFSPDRPGRYHILVASDIYPSDQVLQLLGVALACGYGRAKSRGMGNITVDGCAPYQWPAVDQPNAVILLGPCAPAKDDPTEGFWRVSTKFGRLEGHWATGPGPSGKHNPFKRPVSYLTAGSALRTSSPRPWYGRLLGDVHPDLQEVRHYAIALACPVRIAMEA
ncbi:MAG: hypothetical protein QHH07_12470 [Sedimentisphaerales bacterium]|nr:hypothetical protein [Sedimentisphaerales bacterium]